MFKSFLPCAIGAVLFAAQAAQAQAPRTVSDLFGAAQTQQMLMQMEVALAKVQARRGIIPAAAATEIERTARVELVTPVAVAEERRKVGHPLVALRLGGFGRWVFVFIHAPG